MRHWLIALTLLLPCAQASAQGSHNFHAATGSSSGLDITLSPWLNAAPHVGYFPVSVSVTNNTGRDGVWEVSVENNEFNGLSSQNRFSIRADKGSVSTSTHLAVAVLGNRTRDRSWTSTTFKIQGPEVTYPGLGSIQGCQIEPVVEESFVALGTQSQTLFPWLNSDIDLATARSSPGIGGSKVITEHTPTDWRGLSGLTSYWMSENEWRSLRGSQKSAVLEWVAMGGHVVIAGNEGSKAEELLTQTVAGFKQQDKKAVVGLGTVAVVEGEVHRNEVQTKSRLQSQNGRTIPYLLESYRTFDWKARDLVPAPTVQTAVIFLFLVVFALLAGPVNLFVFAKSTQRHKLFWTTPLISLVGSVLLLVIIFLSDGTGGSGVRLTVGVMVPEMDRVVIRQEQICRTGVLMGSSFPIAEPSLMNRLEFQDRSRRYDQPEQLRLVENESTRSGDWFQSRSVQAHAVQTVRATRGEVRFRADGDKPTVVSSFDVPLERLWLVDEEGKLWIANDISPGERKTLQQSKEISSLSGWKHADDSLPVLCGSLLRDALRPLQQNPRSIVLAQVKSGSAAKLAIPTLDSIDWKDDQAYLVGSYVIDAP